MNPKPFSELNHFTVPLVAMLAVSSDTSHKQWPRLWPLGRFQTATSPADREETHPPATSFHERVPHEHRNYDQVQLATGSAAAPPGNPGGAGHIPYADFTPAGA